MADLYYKAVPGVEVVPLEGEKVLFCSDASQARIEGAFAVKFARDIFPLLDGSSPLSKVCLNFPDLTEEKFRTQLDRLVEMGVLTRAASESGDLDPRRESFYNFHASLGLSAEDLSRSLAASTVAIAGLEGFGAQIAMHLAQYGVGQLILVDPFPCQPGNLFSMGGISTDALGTPREEAVSAEIKRRGVTETSFRLSGGPLDEQSFGAVVEDSSVIVGGFDKGFSSTNHWINRISLDKDIPALYAMAAGHRALVGPTVLPGKSACYMCYRMRVIACEENFEEAMTYEEFLDAKKEPELHLRPGLPSVHSYLASVVVVELLRILLGLSPPALANKTLEFDALSLSTEEHPFFFRPDCEVCKKKRVTEPNEPALSSERDPLRKFGTRLISEKTGIAKTLQRVPKDFGEPAVPYIYRTYLANHQFLDEAEESTNSCSGKGFTREDAIVSALGETVERYSASFVHEEAIRYCQRKEIESRSLDPRELVLFDDDQYEQLPYAPYEEGTVLGWVESNSLVFGESRWVPAIAVYLNYQVNNPDEYLFPITSNGLAAGRTLPEAILRAALEVIERDAVMCMWLNRISCHRIDASSHPDQAVRMLCAQYADRGVSVELFEIPTDHPCRVFFAVGFDESPAQTGPAAVVGMGADLNPSVAARRAILEVAQIRPALRRRMWREDVVKRRIELLESPSEVTTLDDHDLLYTNLELVEAFDFLRNTPVTSIQWNHGKELTSEDQLDLLTEHFREVELDLIWHDLTPADMREFGVHTVRAIIPEYQPIHFGRKERRLGGNRLYELPLILGQRTERTSRAQLNPLPHPVA